MKKNKSSKKKSNDNSKLTDFFKQQALTFFVYFSLFFITSLISLLAGIKTTEIFYVSIIVFCFSGFLCGYLSGRKNRKNGIATGFLCVLPSVLIFIIFSLILNNFKIDLIKTTISFVLMLITGIVGSVIGVNVRLKAKKRGR